LFEPRIVPRLDHRQRLFLVQPELHQLTGELLPKLREISGHFRRVHGDHIPDPTYNPVP